METKNQLLATMDATTKQLKFKAVRVLIIIAQDVIDKINSNEKATTGDFKQLSEYTGALDKLLDNFFHLPQLQIRQFLTRTNWNHGGSDGKNR